MIQIMTSMARPVLWSFRRCPYAIRARMAVLNAGIGVELREIRLKDKPKAFLDVSTSTSVPKLEAGGLVLEESLDIMVWALRHGDPHGLQQMLRTSRDLIAQNDGPFKAALDHTKYAVRYPELDPEKERAQASGFVHLLEKRLATHTFLTGDTQTIADLAIFPFIRQFANIDRTWFDAQPWPNVINWLDGFLQSPAFQAAMTKVTVWEEGRQPCRFGAPDDQDLA